MDLCECFYVVATVAGRQSHRTARFEFERRLRIYPVVRGQLEREDVVTVAVQPAVSLVVLASGVGLLLREFNRC